MVLIFKPKPNKKGLKKEQKRELVIRYIYKMGDWDVCFYGLWFKSVLKYNVRLSR